VVKGSLRGGRKPHNAHPAHNPLHSCGNADQGGGLQFQQRPGAPGALFGIAAAPNGSGNQVIYFNDDNDNTVKSLSK
jgi:hypothetical protein